MVLTILLAVLLAAPPAQKPPTEQQIAENASLWRRLHELEDRIAALEEKIARLEKGEPGGQDPKDDRDAIAEALRQDRLAKGMTLAQVNRVMRVAPVRESDTSDGTMRVWELRGSGQGVAFRRVTVWFNDAGKVERYDDDKVKSPAAGGR